MWTLCYSTHLIFNDGFALLCPVKNGQSLEIPITKVSGLKDESGNDYDAIVQNWFASWLYLVRFYMYDMPAVNIKCNAISGLYVKYIKACRTHTVEFPAEEDPDEFELIRTSLGNGKISEISVNIDTRQAKIKLLYGPK